MKTFIKICALLFWTVLTLKTVQAAIDCEGMGQLQQCMRPNDQSNGNATGQFICRRRFQQGVGIRPRVQYQSLCIAKSWGRASDRCGCCATACPSVCGELCPNPIGSPAGQLGVWIYDWYSFSPYRMCVSPGRSLQLQQQNGQKWRCMQNNRWFQRMIWGEKPKYNEDGTAQWP